MTRSRRRFAVDDFGNVKRALDVERAELETLMPAELKTVLGELHKAQAELDAAINDLVMDAFQSPFGDPHKPPDLDKPVQAGRPAPQANLVRVANADTAEFVTGDLVGLVREVLGSVRDAREVCGAELKGVDYRTLPRRGHRRRRT